MDKVTTNLLDIGGKAHSKAELYKLLTVEGHLFLPPYKYCSIDFMADIIEEKRKVNFENILDQTTYLGSWNKRSSDSKLAPYHWLKNWRSG